MKSAAEVTTLWSRSTESNTNNAITITIDLPNIKKEANIIEE